MSFDPSDLYASRVELVRSILTHLQDMRFGIADMNKSIDDTRIAIDETRLLLGYPAPKRKAPLHW